MLSIFHIFGTQHALWFAKKKCKKTNRFELNKSIKKNTQGGKNGNSSKKDNGR